MKNTKLQIPKSSCVCFFSHFHQGLFPFQHTLYLSPLPCLIWILCPVKSPLVQGVSQESIINISLKNSQRLTLILLNLMCTVEISKHFFPLSNSSTILSRKSLLTSLGMYSLAYHALCCFFLQKCWYYTRGICYYPFVFAFIGICSLPVNEFLLYF